MEITREQYSKDIRDAKKQAWDEGAAAGHWEMASDEALVNPYQDDLW